MDRLARILAIFLLVGAALAGCTDDADAPESVLTPETTPDAPPATTTPAATTPVAVTPAEPAQDAPTIDGVYVVSLTDRLDAPGDASVCWRVEGSGVIPHTAVHFDAASHPESTDFADYAGGAVYPDNGPATTAGSFALPGTFCAQLRELDETTYLRAHAMAPGVANVLSPEKVIPVGQDATVDVVNFLEVFPAKFTNAVCWEGIGLSGTATHTALHFDDESHPNGTFGDYDLGAVYPGNGPATMEGSFALPGPFCANLTMPESGALYLRAHAIVDGTSHLGPERVIQVAPRVAVSDGLPATAAAGSTVNVCWRAEGFGTSGHTALHFDTQSHPDATSFQAYDGGAAYPDNGPATTTGSFELPGPFCADLTMPASGTLYFRPHAIYPGGFSEIGPEYAIDVA